jgi:hypothetical protein
MTAVAHTAGVSIAAEPWGQAADHGGGQQRMAIAMRARQMSQICRSCTQGRGGSSA